MSGDSAARPDDLVKCSRESYSRSTTVNGPSEFKSHRHRQAQRPYLPVIIRCQARRPFGVERLDAVCAAAGGLTLRR